MTTALWFALLLLAWLVLSLGTEKYRDALARRRMHESDELIRERKQWEDSMEREAREWFHRLRVATEREILRARMEAQREAMELWEDDEPWKH